MNNPAQNVRGICFCVDDWGKIFLTLQSLRTGRQRWPVLASLPA